MYFLLHDQEQNFGQLLYFQHCSFLQCVDFKLFRKEQRIILLSNGVRDLFIVQIDTLRCTDLNMQRMDAGFKNAS